MPNRPLKTHEFIALFSMITALTAVSIDAILPALQAIGLDLAVVDQNETLLIIPVFILGMVFGELVFGPLSDAIGRKPAIIIGLLIYGLGTVVAMTAPSIDQVLIGRLIQGIGVSGPKIASRALIRDLYKGEAMAKMLSLIFAVFILVPLIAPSIGQLVLIHAGWRSIFLLLLGWAVLSAVWLLGRQAETLPPERRIRLSPISILRNARAITKHPKVMAYTIAAGFVFGAQLLFLSTAQALFIDLYDAEDRFPLYFAALAVAIGMAFLANSYLVTRHGMIRLCLSAVVGLTVAGTVHLAVAIAYQGQPPFFVFMALLFSTLFCIGFLFGNLNAMAMQSLGNVAGIGASLIASISSLIAVVLAVLFSGHYDETVYPLVAGFLLAGLVSMALIVLAERSVAGDLIDQSMQSR